MDLTEIFYPARAAEFLGVSKMTLWRWKKAGKIKALTLDGRQVYALGELVRVKEQAK